MSANRHQHASECDPQRGVAAGNRFGVRTVTLDDAREISRIVAASQVLDVNSPYCYLLLCRDFAETCLVACLGSLVVGFVSAYRPPGRGDVVFVWQIGVDDAARGRGVARHLLDSLVSLPACREVRFLEATVTPSNEASRRLFQSFAAARGATCEISSGFSRELFGGEHHEAEDLFRIGPFN